MQSFSKLPIRHKLTLISMLTTGVALMLACTSFVAFDLASLKRDLIADISSVAEIIGYNSASALSFNDASSAQETLRALEAKPHVVAACVYDHNGRIFATYPPGRSAAYFVPPPSVATKSFGSDRFDLYQPIIVSGENVGTIYLRSDLGRIREKFKRYAIIIGAVMAVAILVAYLIAMRLQRVISAPVSELVAVANEVAANKNYAIRAAKRGNDELGQLIDGFNDMLGQIQTRDSALRSANDGLELRVEKRTAELQEENAERKRAEGALQAKTALLEAQMDSSIDGILVVDNEGKRSFQNHRMVDLWKIPIGMDTGADDASIFRIMAEAVRHPEIYDERILHIYAHPHATSRDEVALRNGTVLDRNSAPVIGKDGKHYGRIWAFRDITERKRAEAELEKVHRELLAASRQAGMAEVATGVLHNVGNVLNSVNVSATIVADYVRHTKAGNIAKLAVLFSEHKSDLADFLTNDSRGQMIPGYLDTLASSLTNEHRVVMDELVDLHKNIGHIKDIVAMQQNNAKNSGFIETVSLAELVEDALRINMNSLTRHGISLVRDFQMSPVISTDKHKIVQILVNLLRNAIFACEELGRKDKRITVKIEDEAPWARISVGDNGIGIPAENLTRVFNHGFTTRDSGHGFGLHSGALAAKELGGSLMVLSDGPGCGAKFILELPYKTETQTL